MLVVIWGLLAEEDAGDDFGSCAVPLSSFTPLRRRPQQEFRLPGLRAFRETRTPSTAPHGQKTHNSRKHSVIAG